MTGEIQDGLPPVAPPLAPAPVAAQTSVDVRWRRPVLALALVYAWFGAYAPSFTLTSDAVVVGGVVPVLVAMVFCRNRRLPLPASIRPRGVATWALILGSFAVQEVVNVALGSHRPHPSLSVLLDPTLDNHLARAAALFVWIGVGLELARR